MKNNIFSDAFRTIGNLVVDMPEEKPDEEHDDSSAKEASPRASESLDDFIKKDNERDLRRRAEEVAAAATPASLPVAPVAVAPVAKPVIADGNGVVDYAALYQVGNIPPTPMPAERCLEFIASLPEGLPVEVKRQTVRISVQTMGGVMGATPQTIVSDARAKSDAIAQFMAANDADTAEYIQTAEGQINELEAKIASLKSGIGSAQNRRQNIYESCLSESNRLKEVVGFFVESQPPPLPTAINHG